MQKLYILAWPKYEKTREPLAFANTIFDGYSRAAGGGGGNFLVKIFGSLGGENWYAETHLKRGGSIHPLHLMTPLEDKVCLTLKGKHFS